MTSLDLLKSLSQKNDGRIVLIVMDGLGGLPGPGGKTELEAARTPNLDALAAEASTGLMYPVGRGITPGSGPGHLSLFGYDPIHYQIGRGALSAAGIGMEQKDGDLAIRTNLCTLAADGTIADRRAGRCATSVTEEVCKILTAGVKIDGIQVLMQAEKDYRAVTIFRGPGLSDQISDVDPQVEGKKPMESRALDDSPEATRAAGFLNQFVRQAAELLKGRAPANGIICRGYSMKPALPSYQDLYKLTAAAIATYPMYNGLAMLAGMKKLPTGDTIASEIDTLEKHWKEFDYFFLHVKKTDSMGEDGNFEGKVKVIEEFDALLPRIRALGPAVIAVAADHSSPAVMAAHSFHPIPCLLWSKICMPDGVREYHERAVGAGALGHFEGKDLMAMLMANAGKLAKYGA